ncbi:hypothetical protein ACFWO0_39025, partial [Streptomyces sp. NPDC058461]
MHAIRVASAAVLGVGALALSTALSAPASAAEGDVTPFGYSVSPTTIAAGGQVTLRIDRVLRLQQRRRLSWHLRPAPPRPARSGRPDPVA